MIAVQDGDFFGMTHNERMVDWGESFGTFVNSMCSGSLAKVDW